jgi:hypothetical protein
MLLVLGGVGGLVFAVFGFALALFTRAGQLALHSMTTLPTLLGLGAILAGRTMLRAPIRVIVGPEGLTLENKHLARHLPWNEVGSAAVETSGMSARRHLNVTDRNGRSIVRLDQSFPQFDEMAALVARHVGAKGDDTEERILRKKAKGRAAGAFVAGLLLAVASGFIGWMTHEEQRASHLLRTRGQPNMAEIVRRFTAPNGVTRRLEYRVVGPTGRFATRNVEVEPAYWQSLEKARKVSVIVVPGEPEISRLAYGEVREHDFTKTPGGGYLLAAAGGALALFMLGVSPLAWSGWDLAHDAKTQTWSLKRYGKVVWSRGGAGTKTA